MRKIIVMFSICFLYLNMVFCFSSSAKTKIIDKEMPEWVINPSSKYPKNNYLSAVGQGINRDSAENKSIEEIVSIFGHKIVAQTETTQRMQQAQAEGLVNLYKSEEINQKITKSEEIDNVIGVDVCEYWFDSNEKTWYALSVIDIAKFSNIYTSMIVQNDNEINHLLKLENIENPSLEAYSYINLAEEIATLNEENIRRLTIVNPDKGSILKAQCNSKTSVHAMLLAMANKIPISVIIQDDFNSRLYSEISKIISFYGFKTTTEADGKYQIKGKFYNEESITKDNQVVYCKYTFDFSLDDVEKNLSIIPYNYSGREGSSTFPDARSRAIKKIETNLSESFKVSFESYIKKLK
jgi:hypothetical protein